MAGRPSPPRRVAERDGTAAELLPADEGQLDVSRGLRQQVGPCPAIRGGTTNSDSSIRPRPAFPASSASRPLHPSQRPALERPLGLCRAASGRRTSGRGTFDGMAASFAQTRPSREKHGTPNCRSATADWSPVRSLPVIGAVDGRPAEGAPAEACQGPRGSAKKSILRSPHLTSIKDCPALTYQIGRDGLPQSKAADHGDGRAGRAERARGSCPGAPLHAPWKEFGR